MCGPRFTYNVWSVIQPASVLANKATRRATLSGLHANRTHATWKGGLAAGFGGDGLGGLPSFWAT